MCLICSTVTRSWLSRKVLPIAIHHDPKHNRTVKLKNDTIQGKVWILKKTKEWWPLEGNEHPVSRSYDSLLASTNRMTFTGLPIWGFEMINLSVTYLTWSWLKHLPVGWKWYKLESPMASPKLRTTSHYSYLPQKHYQVNDATHKLEFEFSYFLFYVVRVLPHVSYHVTSCLCVFSHQFSLSAQIRFTCVWLSFSHLWVSSTWSSVSVFVLCTKWSSYFLCFVSQCCLNLYFGFYNLGLWFPVPSPRLFSWPLFYLILINRWTAPALPLSLHLGLFPCVTLLEHIVIQTKGQPRMDHAWFFLYVKAQFGIFKNKCCCFSDRFVWH